MEAFLPVENVRFDGVLIIGSGPLGSTYARMLVDEKSRFKDDQKKEKIPVIMIDIGAQLSSVPGEHLKNTVYFHHDVNKFTGVIQSHLQTTSVPVDDSVVPTLDPIAFSFNPIGTHQFGQNPDQVPYYNLPAQASTYAVGGMATHWTACTPREHPIIERSPLLTTCEWDLLYDKAEDFVKTNSHVFDHSIRHKLVKKTLLDSKPFSEIKEDIYKPQSLPLGVQPPNKDNLYITWSGVDTILGEALLKYAKEPSPLFRILPEWQAFKVVRSHSKDEIKYAVIQNLRNGKVYNVHANAIVIACNATLTPQLLYNSGFSHDFPALGKYICEQPLAFCQIVLKKEIVDEIVWQEKTSPVFTIDNIPIPIKDPPPQCWIPVSEGREWHCQIHRDAFSYGGIAPNIDQRLIVDLRWFGRVTPNKENYIEFRHSNKDTFGMPQPSYHFEMSDDDAKRNHAMMKDMLLAADALGGFLPGSNPTFTEPGLALHLTGSTRMGEDKETSVVDTYCKVWGINNLYLGTCGVIPTGTACNPTLTAMALAIRASGEIINKWCSGQLPSTDHDMKYPKFEPSTGRLF